VPQNPTYDRIAPLYDLIDAPYEYGWRRRLRRTMFTGLAGRILDAGAGTGANLPFYPAGAEMHGCDASPAMLARAAARARSAGRAVAYRPADLTALPYPDGHFDAVVSTFVFTVLDDAIQLPALREIGRVCRTGGEIRLLDYRMSQRPLLGAAMRVAATWSGLLFDCWYRPTTDRWIEAAGLELVEERFLLADAVKRQVLRPRR
jgi:ubiquinone/menaquinone biosynthesis C-methylase UbiE